MRGWAAAVTLCALMLSGCFSANNPDALREQTANATAAAKRDAGAVAKGVFEGLTRKGPVDVNRASAKELETLPGIAPVLAGSVIEHRPYRETADLVKKHVLTRAEYEQVRERIVARP